jgi:uncharacterized protein (DUF1800 family)
MDIQHLHHLMWRSGFGTDLRVVEKNLQKSKATLVKEIFNIGEAFTPIDIATKPASNLRDNFKNLDKEEKENLKKFNLEELKDINLQWQRLLVYSQDQVREKTALFWHDHFACFVPYAYMMQLHINKLREHALGSFRDLLHLISKDAAMLVFLNNTQNKKKHPNENFAREVMELFTIGIGNYTEDDIKEAAKAFTGWNYDEDGNFEIREKQHDDGPKTFMGVTQNFEGEDIINALLDNPKTAHRIVSKIYAWFVNEEVDEDRVKELADFYYTNNYHTGDLLKKIFDSDWFYEAKNIGTHIKSPIELLTGIRRTFVMDFKNEEVLFFLQKILGQILGHPPNVSGWKDGKPWIDSSTLLFRLKLSDHIFNNSDFDVVDKDQAETTSFKGKFKKMEAGITMDHIYQLMPDTSKTTIKKLLTQYLMVCTNQLAEQLKTPDTDELQIFVNQYVQELLRQPEYQLC